MAVLQTQTKTLIFPFLYQLFICLVCISVGWKGQEVSIKGVFKHHTSATPVAEQYPDREVAPLLSHTQSHRQTGTNMGGEEKCINVQIAFIKLCHTASGLVVKDLCSAGRAEALPFPGA